MHFRVKWSGSDIYTAFLGTHPLLKDFPSWDANGHRRLASQWTIPTLTIESSRKELPDWSFVMPSVPIVSARAMEALDGLLSNVEALLVNIATCADSFYLLNIPAVNALDLSLSRFEMWKSTPGRLKSITQAVFCEDVREPIFSLRSFPCLYCSDAFRSQAYDASLRGFECTNILEVP